MESHSKALTQFQVHHRLRTQRQWRNKRKEKPQKAELYSNQLCFIILYVRNCYHRFFLTPQILKIKHFFLFVFVFLSLRSFIWFTCDPYSTETVSFICLLMLFSKCKAVLNTPVKPFETSVSTKWNKHFEPDLNDIVHCLISSFCSVNVNCCIFTEKIPHLVLKYLRSCIE